MNEVLKVNYETEEPTVSAKDLYDVLGNCKLFEEFFIKVCELKCAFAREDLKVLREVARTFVYKFQSTAITYLTDSITAEMSLPCKQEITVKIKEKEMQGELLNNFSYAFPKYKILGSEIPLKSIGRIDILAEDTESGRPVIMELKIGSKSPNKQLLAYATSYENPILIGITEEPLSEELKYYGISYRTFRELKEGAELWTS